MIRTHIPFLVIASLALGAQKQDKPQMTDKPKSFALWFTESSIERIDKETNAIDVSGNPMHGYSKEQNLEFSAHAMKGVVKSVPGGSMIIQNATISGNAIFNITSEKGKTTLKMAKATLTDDGASAVISIPTSFECTNFSTSSGGAGQSGSRSMNLTASQGTFNLKTLAKRDDDPLISADLSGPVKVVVVANDEKGKTTLYTLTGNSAKIRIEGTDKVVTMVGDVHVTSDSDIAIGNMEVPNVTVVLSKELEVKSVRTKGSGTGTIKEKKDGQ